ncbi:MAG: hypothetical protein IPJ34_27305 [Myxococcales bacterium]|nr:hypothetical protein [Myxococcales bacterium]
MKTSDPAALALAFSLALGIAVGPATVCAEASELDKANARKLFNEGLDLRKAGDPSGALAKFEAADALLPTPRGRLELGRQRVLVGLLVEGYTTLNSVAQLKVDPKDEGKYAPHRAEAQKLALEVEARIPTLRVEVVGGPATVQIDGVVVPNAALSQPRLLNPGKHVVVVRSEVGVEKREELVLQEAEAKTVKLDVQKPVDPPPAGGAVAPPPKSLHTAPPSSPGPVVADRGDGLGTQRTWALVAGGVGAVGLIVGTWAGLSARSIRDEAAPFCPFSGGGCTDPRGVDLKQKALDRADLSTIAFVSAGVLLAGATVLWFTAPSRDGKPAARAGLVVGLGSIGLSGRF